MCLRDSSSDSRIQAYEKGIALFKWPLVFDIWNLYLTKFIQRYVSLLDTRFANTPALLFRAGRNWNEHGISSSSVSSPVRPISRRVSVVVLMSLQVLCRYLLVVREIGGGAWSRTACDEHLQSRDTRGRTRADAFGRGDRALSRFRDHPCRSSISISRRR